MELVVNAEEAERDALLAAVDRVRDPVAAMKSGRETLDKHNHFLIEKGQFTCRRCGWSGPNVNDHRALIAWSAIAGLTRGDSPARVPIGFDPGKETQG